MVSGEVSTFYIPVVKNNVLILVTSVVIKFVTSNVISFIKDLLGNNLKNSHLFYPAIVVVVACLTINNIIVKIVWFTTDIPRNIFRKNRICLILA